VPCHAFSHWTRKVQVRKDCCKPEALSRGNMGQFTVNSTPHAVPVYACFGFKATGPQVETKGIAFVPMRYAA
jgi:predicted GNAT family N-acyltransferase